ncbi:hypothetical protein [Enhygromyxa salina]|uniref:hypothetical protein n=1 Tax=Enhygromyxa salina TaxID=215803 RepID=UPI000D087F06|nr:hypothetical protein [Enhygromyxa salina]
MNASNHNPPRAASGPPAGWSSLLADLRRRTSDLGSRSRWSVEWAIHRWASDHLPSAAIRIERSEGLTGPAPARWRLLTHIDPETGAHALAVLGGRAPLLASNVVASMINSSRGEAVVAVRGVDLQRWGRAPERHRSDSEAGQVDRAIDIALARRAAPSSEIPLPLRLAVALALETGSETREDASCP